MTKSRSVNILVCIVFSLIFTFPTNYSSHKAFNKKPKMFLHLMLKIEGFRWWTKKEYFLWKSRDITLIILVQNDLHNVHIHFHLQLVNKGAENMKTSTFSTKWNTEEHPSGDNQYWRSPIFNNTNISA